MARMNTPGNDALRQAIVLLPIGLIGLLLGAIIDGDGAVGGVATALLVIGVLAAALGLLRLLQGAYQRLG